MGNFAKRLLKGDVILFSIIIVLMLASLLLIYSSTGRLAYNEQDGNTWYYFFRQLALCATGLVVMWGMKFFSWRWLYQNVGLLLLISAGLVALAAFSGENINGAGRWIRIPVIGITFQPSEAAKIAVVLYAAKLLSDYQEEKECASEVLKYFWAPLVVIGLIFLDNFSTSVLVGVVCLVMCWIARVRWKLLAKWLGIGVGALVVLLLLGIAFPKVKEAGRLGTIISRLTAFVSKDRDTEEGKNYNYQSDQAHIAVAKGGMTGCGPGNSTQRNFLPHPYSDFIYAIIIEEYGLVGGIFIFLFYTIILFRVGVIARKTLKTETLNPRGGPEIFPALVVVGLGFSIVLQAMFHMGVNVGALPVTGQTLPLVSMGGTSLWFIAAALGIILNIAYSFSPEGAMEECERTKTKKEKNTARKSRQKYEPETFDKEEIIDEIAEGELPRADNVPEEGYRRRRRAAEQVPDDIDVIGDEGLPDIGEQLESEGREVLKELRRKGRRGAANEMY